MICVAIISKDTASAIAEMQSVAGLCDLIEIRLDYIQNPDLHAILANKPCPLIATNRPTSEGGQWQGSEEDRIALLRKAVALGFDFVDVEIGCESHFRERGATRLIVSYHNFKETPADLTGIYERLAAAGGDVVKLVTTANSILDNLRIFELLRKASAPTIAFCMGECGIISRILAPKFGGFLSFSSVARGREAAPGQISASDMRNLYRVHKINRQTAIYGVIANPVAHSMSPAIHNAAFAAKAIDAVYLPFKVEKVVEFIKAFRALDVQGYSVTIPHKEAALRAVDEVDPFVHEIGALNTIVNRGGRLYGFNTDWQAAITAIEKVMLGATGCLQPVPSTSGAASSPPLPLAPSVGGTACLQAVSGSSPTVSPLKGKRVALLGAGGTARAIAYGLRHRGASMCILNRTVERAEQLARDVGCQWGPLGHLGRLEYDVLVNTTSIGMHPKVDESPAPAELLRHALSRVEGKGLVVFDAVYNPPVTRLLREAAAAGCLTASGVDMFVNQAVAQFEMWTGQPAPVQVMRETILQRLTGK
jgi:3-dehydroquinate dehydratase/shikimate dehydrogenase